MPRPSRNISLCYSPLEEALAACPEAWRHLDLLCAGWPCQGNSQAGSRQGLRDDRSSLWYEVSRLLGLFRPQWFVGENVPGLFSVNAGRDFWTILADLDTLGYCVAWDVLDAKNFGVAQRRARIFLVASFGNVSAARVLFEPDSHSGHHPTHREMEPVGVCLSTRDGRRQDPSSENLFASVIKASDYSNTPIGQFGNENNLVAHTLNTGSRGAPFKCWTEDLVASVDAHREGAVARISAKLDSFRGVVLGNAVAVPVAKWVAKRILLMEKRERERDGCTRS